MRRNTAASMYGGSPSRGSRASVTSLDGLRSKLRNETERDSAPAPVAAPNTRSAPSAPSLLDTPGDDKQVLRGLNNRLTGYLDRVKNLQEENDNLKNKIDDILSKRRAPKGRDWDEVQSDLEALRQKIKDITMKNAELMQASENAKMANDDLKNKLDGEKNARKVLEKDLEDLRRIMDDIKTEQDNTQREIDMVKNEIDRLLKEHQEIVENLFEKIRNSEVTVDIEPDKNNLSSIVKNMRKQYEKVAEQNLKDAQDWYNSKFENIKVVEAQNTEALQAGKSELKEKQKEIRSLEMQIQSLLSKIKSLEENLKSAKLENNQRLGSINSVLMNLEAELVRVRSQVEHQAEVNKALVGVKMKLEKEISTYQGLINQMTSDESLGLP